MFFLSYGFCPSFSIGCSCLLLLVFFLEFQITYANIIHRNFRGFTPPSCDSYVYLNVIILVFLPLDSSYLFVFVFLHLMLIFFQFLLCVFGYALFRISDYSLSIRCKLCLFHLTLVCFSIFCQQMFVMLLVSKVFHYTSIYPPPLQAGAHTDSKSKRYLFFFGGAGCALLAYKLIIVFLTMKVHNYLKI